MNTQTKAFSLQNATYMHIHNTIWGVWHFHCWSTQILYKEEKFGTLQGNRRNSVWCSHGWCCSMHETPGAQIQAPVKWHGLLSIQKHIVHALHWKSGSAFGMTWWQFTRQQWHFTKRGIRCGQSHTASCGPLDYPATGQVHLYRVFVASGTCSRFIKRGFFSQNPFLII